MAGILDTARFSAFIAWETGASVQGRAGDGARRPRRPDGAGRLGHHGRRHPPRAARAEGTHREDGRANTKGGGELVKLLGTSAWYAPGVAAAQMVDVDLSRPEARASVYRVPRGRIRHPRPLHGRAGEARRGRDRRDPAAAAHGRREEDAARVRGGRARSRQGARRRSQIAMDLGLNGRSAIVCGASAGMGLAIAEALAAEGARGDVRPPQGTARARGGTHRRARRPGGPHRAGRRRDPRRARRRGVRGHRRARAQRRRPSGRPRGRSQHRAGPAGGRSPLAAARQARRPVPPAPAWERSRPHRGDRVDVGEGAVAEPRTLERRAPGCRRAG